MPTPVERVTPEDDAEAAALDTFARVYGSGTDSAVAAGLIVDGADIEPVHAEVVAALAETGVTIEFVGAWVEGDAAWIGWRPFGVDGVPLAVEQVALLRRTDDRWLVDRDRFCRHAGLLSVACPAP